MKKKYQNNGGSLSETRKLQSRPCCSRRRVWKHEYLTSNQPRPPSQNLNITMSEEAEKQKFGPPQMVFQTENQLRDKIKELQEKRAAGLMAEISDLQKEKGMAIGQVKKLDSMVADIRKENALMKKKERDFVCQIQKLERSLLEEKLINDSYKRKCQSLEKKNKTLLKKLETLQQQQSTLMINSPPQLTASDKCSSLTDLSHANSREPSSPAAALTNSLVISSSSSPFQSPCNSPIPSPSVIHRRYRLATIQTLEKETQTDMEESEISTFDSNGHSLPKPILEVLTSAEKDILSLQQQKKDLQTQLQKLAHQKQTAEEMQQKYKSQTKLLNEEAEILRDSLSQFSKWVQTKISAIEEDLDLYRIVYSLHGSLSKEAELVGEIHQKLSLSEKSLQEERTINKHLAEALKENENQLKQLQTENSELKEQLLTYYGISMRINELRLQPHNLTLPSPLARHRAEKHKHKHSHAIPTIKLITGSPVL